MARVRKDTGVWHVEGSEIYHIFHDCKGLKDDVGKIGKPGVAKEAREAGSLRNICEACREKFDGIPDVHSEDLLE